MQGSAVIACALVCALISLAASGVTNGAGGPLRQNSDPQRTLAKLGRRVTVAFDHRRLEEVLQHIADLSGAVLEPHWSDSGDIGLERDQLISLSARDAPALALLERVLTQAQADLSAGNAWQLTQIGTIEVGPKERLNRCKRAVLYSVRDLLMEIPSFDEVPAIDLESLLQQGRAGGGQSPIREQTQQPSQTPAPAKPIEQLVTLILETIEPEQWVERGGDGAWIRDFRGDLLIVAPEYIHRQIRGYQQPK